MIRVKVEKYQDILTRKINRNSSYYQDDILEMENYSIQGMCVSGAYVPLEDGCIIPNQGKYYEFYVSMGERQNKDKRKAKMDKIIRQHCSFLPAEYEDLYPRKEESECLESCWCSYIPVDMEIPEIARNETLAVWFRDDREKKIFKDMKKYNTEYEEETILLNEDNYLESFVLFRGDII